MSKRARTGILASHLSNTALTVTQTPPPDVAADTRERAIATPDDPAHDAHGHRTHDPDNGSAPGTAALRSSEGEHQDANALMIAAEDRVVEDEPLQPEWQALPPRAHTVFRYVALLTALAPGSIVSLVIYNRFREHPMVWVAIGGVLAAAIALGLWFAYRRYRYTFWKLDRDGFAVKRGRLWQWETRVPTTRVQHMDLKRGPLERAHGLASVILHTAGTRLSAVGVSGMEHRDAERLRDYLTRQIDRQDGDEPEHA
jgi:uncharacterized protein